MSLPPRPARHIGDKIECLAVRRECRVSCNKGVGQKFYLLRVTPSGAFAVRIHDDTTLALTFAGLAAGKKYLGSNQLRMKVFRLRTHC